MSANPTRVEWDASAIAAEPGFPLQEGNRVLDSLARQEALRALLAFSDLHGRIRNRRAEGTASASDIDLFQTERFVLDEVLQLVCDRALAITHSDAVLVALAEGSQFICRAGAGSLGGERGTQLLRESEFLQDCLDSGRILRCDDCAIDARVDLDFSRQIGARSTVLVPLRGQRTNIGVLQAFSDVPFSFSDDDVRSLDLFAEPGTPVCAPLAGTVYRFANNAKDGHPGALCEGVGSLSWCFQFLANCSVLSTACFNCSLNVTSEGSIDTAVTISSMPLAVSPMPRYEVPRIASAKAYVGSSFKA